MKNSEKINLKIGNTSGNKISEQELALRSKAIFFVWTYEDVVNFIDVNFEDEAIKKELLKIAKKYPISAYENFIKNIQSTVSLINKKRTEASEKDFKNTAKVQFVKTDIQEIKSELSIEEEIQKELKEKETQEKPETQEKSNEETISKQELEKEFE